MADVVVRPVRIEEIDAVGALTERAYRAYGYFDDGVALGYAAKLADARSRAETAELLVAVDGGDQLLGTVTIVLPGTAYAEVSRAGELEFRMLAVDPAVSRRGVGGTLVQAVIDRARDLGVPRVVLSSHNRMTAVHRVYQRLGFRRLPDRDWYPLPEVRLIGFGLDLRRDCPVGR